MPTVDEYMAMLTPDPAQLKQQKIAALLGGLGAGLLSAPGWNRGIANAGLLAAQGVNAVPYQMRQDAIDNIKMREAVQGLADKDQQRASDQAWQSQLPALFQGPSPAQRLGSGAPTVGNAAALNAMPGETAFQKYSRLADAAFAAGRPNDAKIYAEYADKNRPKVKNENTGTDAQGNRVRYVTYEDGTTQVLPLGPDKEKLNFVSTGGQVGVGLDPFTGKQQSAGLAATMSPEQIDASKRGWANFGLEKQKYIDQKTSGKPQWDSASGQFVYPPSQEAPSGRAVQPQGFMGKNANSNIASQKALAAVGEAKQILDDATGSYLGAGVDIASQAFGHATEGAKNIAKLKVLESNIMMNQPRMEGPQSDKDVQLYRQAAGQLGDPTVPNEIKRAALDTIESLHSKYASIQGGGKGATGGWSITTVK